MRVRVALILTILGLALAVIAAPVAAGGGNSLVIGNNGADGEVGSGFGATLGQNNWGAFPNCWSGDVVNTQEEFRFALEFPLSGLPTGATITGATLSLQNYGSSPFIQHAVIGYAGDGSIAAADVQVTGTPVLFTPTASGVKEDHDVTGLISDSMVSAGWAGFSVREAANVDDYDPFWCPGQGEFGLTPILTLLYDLPIPPTPTPTPQGSLADAAMTPPGSSSPLPALGFAVLLIGALGALTVMSARRTVSRR